MKKIIILSLVVLIFCSVLVSADPSYIYKQNDPVDLKVTCLDEDNAYCLVSTDCKLTINSPDSSNLIKNVSLTYSENFFNYTLSPTLTNILGEYFVSVRCASNDSNAFSTFSYLLTPTGREPSLVQGMVYVILLVIFMTLTSFTILGAFHLDGRNQYDFGGKLVKVNVNKYIKIGLFFISYLFLIVIFLFCEMIADNFLVISFARGIFHTLFVLSCIGFFPILLGTIVLWILRLVADVYIYRLTKRGLKPR